MIFRKGVKMERKDKINYYLDIAQTVAQRSTCLRRKYGAIIVKNDEVISTGYNGAPRGCTNCSDKGSCKREELNIPSGERYELCLAGDTIIKLLDGIETIESLCNRGVEFVDIYAVDTNTDKIVVVKGCNIHKTGVRKDIVEIILDNGASIRCTSDHLILMENNEYKEAKNLIIGDLLRGMYNINYTDESMIFNIVHKIVSVKNLDIEIPVYDMTVPNYENFAVDLGDNSCIFVHNCRSVHAEQNAIISAARRDMVGATLYLSGLDGKTNKVLPVSEPCSMCKRFILNSGIEQVVMRNGKDYDIIEISVWRLLDIV